MFSNQDKLRELMDYCQKLSSNEKFEESRLLNIIKIVQKVAFFSPAYMVAGTIGMSFSTKERQLPMPVYYPKELMENTIFYGTVLSFQIDFVFAMWQYISVFLSTYIIMIQHISKEFQVISEDLKNLANIKGRPFQRLLSQGLDQVGLKHAQLLEQLSVANSIFSVPLLCNEVFCVACIAITVITFEYEIEEQVFASSGVALISLGMIYSVSGQGISSSAGDFVDAAIECDWLQLFPTIRKRLMLMILMVQQPIGISSGGFHFSKYLKVSQVRFSNFISLGQCINWIHTSFSNFRFLLNVCNFGIP